MYVWNCDRRITCMVPLKANFAIAQQGLARLPIARYIQLDTLKWYSSKSLLALSLKLLARSLYSTQLAVSARSLHSKQHFQMMLEHWIEQKWSFKLLARHAYMPGFHLNGYYSSHWTRCLQLVDVQVSSCVLHNLHTSFVLSAVVKYCSSHSTSTAFH